MTERSEKQKMLAGELYNSTGSELTTERRAAQRLLARYNATGADDQTGRLKPRDDRRRPAFLNICNR